MTWAEISRTELRTGPNVLFNRTAFLTYGKPNGDEMDCDGLVIVARCYSVNPNSGASEADIKQHSEEWLGDATLITKGTIALTDLLKHQSGCAIGPAPGFPITLHARKPWAHLASESLPRVREISPSILPVFSTIQSELTCGSTRCSAMLLQV